MSDAGTSPAEQPAKSVEPQIDDNEFAQEGKSNIVAEDFPTDTQKSWWKSMWPFGRQKHDPSREQLENGRYQSDTRNRNIYAWVLLGTLIVQLIVAHVVIYLTATGPHVPTAGGFYLSDQVVIAYMGSVVVEVIGLVYGIVRGIFPSNDQK